MLTITIKIILAVDVRAVERLSHECMKGTLPNRMSPDHRLRIAVALSRENLSRLFLKLLLYSYKELSAYSARVCTHHILLSTAGF